MLRILVALFLVPGAVLAEEWRKIDGAAIAAALTDQVLIYQNATQRFYASGRTLYNAGQDSWGYWAVRGDQYCSQWPPGDQWDCYDMAMMDRTVRFFGADGSITDGAFTE